MVTQYIVICLDDEGHYVQATSRRFSRKAAQGRTVGIATGRRPVVVEVPAVALDEDGSPARREDGSIVPMYIGEPDEPTVMLTEEGRRTLSRMTSTTED